MNISNFLIDINLKNFGKPFKGKVKAILLSLLILFCHFLSLNPWPLNSIVLAETSKSRSSIPLKGVDELLAEEINEKLESSLAPIEDTEETVEEETSSKPNFNTEKADNFISSILKASLSLAVVLVIIWAISCLFKKYYLKGQLFGGRLIQLVDTCPLGQKKSLALVRVENQTLLIGITQQQIVLISQIGACAQTGLPEKKVEPKNNNTGHFESFANQLSEKSLSLQENKSKSSTTNIATILEDRFKELKKI